MRTPLIVGNWKMNKTVEESVELIKALKQKLSNFKDKDILVCPPFTSLSEAAKLFKRSNIMLGAQNMHFEKSGAYTGEISAEMLKSAGCEFVILGHSERRQSFFETDDVVNKKIRSAIESGLKVILCVGEKLSERERNVTKQVIENQIKGSLSNIRTLKGISIAYEPVWAIGTGKVATPEQAQEVHRFIRDILSGMFGKEALKTRILYGGSVNAENSKSLMEKEDIDGALVGGASLKADSFVAIANS